MKAKLAAAQAKSKSKAHKEKKLTKAQQKEKDEADKKAKEAEAQDAKDKAKARAEAARLAAAARAAEAAAKQASPFNESGKEADEIGLHLGISCDGCGREPPLVGRAMKCKDCPDFDLCDDCYPSKKDRARDAVAVAAGLPAGSGKHPAKHCFGARKAGVLMTEAETAKENAAYQESKKNPPQQGASGGAGGGGGGVVQGVVPSFFARGPAPAPAEEAVRWKPLPQLAGECPVPEGKPTVLGRQWVWDF